MAKGLRLRSVAILIFAGVFGLATVVGFVGQASWPGNVEAIRLQQDSMPVNAADPAVPGEAPADSQSDDERIRRDDDDASGFDDFDDDDDDQASTDDDVGATNTDNTGDGDATRGDDGTSGGNNTDDAAGAANTANTGDGDATRGDDGTSGGNNTGDNDSRSRGGTT